MGPVEGSKNPTQSFWSMSRRTKNASLSAIASACYPTHPSRAAAGGAQLSATVRSEVCG
jgi:hypothetical protein